MPLWDIPGEKENCIMDVLLFALFLQFIDTHWNYKSMPSNKSCLGLTNRQCILPRGEVMEESTVLNYMVLLGRIEGAEVCENIRETLVGDMKVFYFAFFNPKSLLFLNLE